uniref:Uncharacterized protein n=2 Tax=Nyssomyia neivai TaxID=330878 RepID=A0A1L8D9W1_9DIPT
MKTMYQFPNVTTLLVVALCAISFCTAKRKDAAQWAPFRNNPVNHHENVIISYDHPKLTNFVHDVYPKSTTHGATGSTPLGDTQHIIKRTSAANSAMPHSSRLHRRDIRHTTMQRNLCNTDWCKCLGEKILDVECNLPGQAITFGEQFFIPREARSFVVHLGATTRLTVRHGLFQENRINRILFLGPESDSRVHVEFLPNALEGNKAPNPAIEIINCDTVAFKNGTFHGDINLNVTNCRNVIVYEGALGQTNFSGIFDTIGDLRMKPNALNGGTYSLIYIVNSYIERLEKIGNTMREIKIANSTIKEIATKAFGFSELGSIVLERTAIATIEPKAFPEGLFCKTLRIVGCNITTIATQAIVGVGFETMTFEENTVRNIEKNGISAVSVNASVSYNRIEKSAHNWLSIQDFSNLDVNNNSFGEFGAMGLTHSTKSRRCTFFRNAITHAEKYSMELPRDCTMKDVYFYNTCTCNLQWLKDLVRKDVAQLEEISYCSTDAAIKLCFNSSLIRTTTYRREVCSDSPTLDCMKNQKEPQYEGNFIRPEDIGNRNGRVGILYYIAGGVACIIILIVLIGVLIVCLRKKSKRHDRAELITPTPEHSHHSVDRVPKSMRIFTPEDRMIINQTLERMKAKHPPEKYDQVYNNTQKLLNGSLTESEKVLTIGEVVRTLSECENSGEDFVAFTDILYKHLAPKDTNQNDPVYAEPNLIATNDDRTQLDLNHIYAEPHSVQQPLLNNEYAFPVDRNTETGLYTEPVVSSREPQRKLISPYAIGGTTVPHEAGRSTPPNLPDVLSQSTAPSSSEPPLLPQGNVQRIANAFANNPNFHITRSPRSNRTIPKYTIPASKGQQSANGSTGRNHSGPSGLHKKDSGSSDHSGGSDITVKMDDVIDYADA